jgi:ABC-2 type transport system permease protein
LVQPSSGRWAVSAPISASRWRIPLLRLEWRLLVRSRTPWLASSLFVLTSTAALINGRAVVQSHRIAAAEAITAQVEQHAALKQDLVRVEEQRARAGVPQTRLQPGLPSAGSVEARVNTFRAALQPLAIAVVGAGSTELVPQRYEIRGGGGARFWPFGRTVGTKILSGLTPEQPMDNPAASVLGGFDLAFVTVYLYPLLIVALMYDVVSRDREIGTLALIAAQPTTFGTWLTMRVAVRGIVIAICGVLLPAIGTACTMTEWSGDGIVRLGVWCAGVLAYSIIWTALAVVVSVQTRISALAAVIAVSVWLVIVIAIPALLHLAAPFLSPASTHLSYATEERAASLETNARVDAAIAALNQLVRKRFSGVPPVEGDHPTFTEPVDPPVDGELLQFPQSPWVAPATVVRLNRGFAEARRSRVEQRLGSILAELDANERREAAFFAIARFSSPALVLQTMADDLAGTGQHRWKSFLAQLDEYVRQRDAFFVGKILSNANVTAHDIDSALLPLRYREEPLPALMWRAALPLTVLASIASALSLACVPSTRRWRV